MSDQGSKQIETEDQHIGISESGNVDIRHEICNVVIKTEPSEEGSVESSVLSGITEDNMKEFDRPEYVPEVPDFNFIAVKTESDTITSQNEGMEMKYENENCSVDDDNDKPDIVSPAEIYEAANASILNLLPENSRQIYLKQYNIFMEWCKVHNMTNLEEDVLLEFFLEKSKDLKSSTLWSTYSMLKSTIMVKNNIDISKYLKLNYFLKQINVGYQANKSAVFTKNDVTRFLTEAPDEKYLMWKVCLIIGLAGACRRNELRQMSINHLQDKGDVLIITIPETKSDIKRVFTIDDDMIENISVLQLIRKYLSLRPLTLRHQALFINFRLGRCSSQVVGVHTFGKIPSLIAQYLQLPDASRYTGHSFRRSSASLRR